MKRLLTIAAVVLAINASAQLHIGSGSHIVMVGDPALNLHGVGVRNDGAVDPGTGTIIFSGAGDANIEGTAPMELFNVKMAKSFQGSVVNLFQNLAITNRLEFESGLVNLGNRNLDLGTTGELINEQENSRIFSNDVGVAIARRILSFPVAQNPGNLGAVITASANMGEVTVRRGHRSQTNGNGQGNSILRYYDIIPVNNNSLDATLRFQYFDAELNSIQESTLMLWSSPDNSAWTNRGYSIRDGATNFVELEDISAMMRFTLSSAASPLPVTGLNLTGRWENGRSELRWTTLAEYNNSHFNVQRKYSNEQRFSHVGRVNSHHATGSSQVPATYYFTDPASSARGSIFYQLEQFDLDGQVSYSNTIALNPGSSKTFINFVSTEAIAGNSLFIQAGNMDLATMNISVVDAAGRVYFHRRTGYSSQQVRLPEMARGVYFIRIRSGQHHFVTSFIK